MPLIVLFILILGTNTSFAAPINPNSKSIKMSIYEAINKAGYQRMLTQRIAKSYMAIVCNVEHEKYEKHLKGSAGIFESNLKELNNFSPNEAIRTQIRYIEILWQNYKFIYSDDYSEENALTILKFNDKILEACDDVVRLLEDYAIENTSNKDQEARTGHKGLASILNLSGRQRMLIQRIMFLSLANSHSIGNEKLQGESLKESISTFNDAFRKLMSYVNNTEQIDNELLEISKIWIVMEKELNELLLSEHNTIQFQEKLVKTMKKGEQILFSFDEVVFLYEREQSK